ncbi:hypothetical protein RCH33_800 [Flavobacterium daejeonense]|nr:hypothetical protein RCH33_800 [Flavobacterium daejeonense]
MKKQLHFAFVFLVLLVTSCATDKLEVQENYNTNPESVWAYDGDNTTIIGVIKELKGGTNRIALERRLLKNDVLWENAEPLIIEDKKRILVPFLSINKDNVIGVLSLVKDAEGKTTFDMVVRKDLMNKSAKLPFWKRSLWAGYFKALDKDILGIKNGSPGLEEKLVKDRSSLTMRTECGDVPVRQICITYSECESYDGGETWTNCIDLFEDCYYEYEWQCWEVPDEPIDPNPNDPPTCPDGYEMDSNGSCVPINQCSNTDPEMIFNSLAVADEFIRSEVTNSQTTSKLSETTVTNTNTKFYIWKCITGNIWYKIISTEIGVTKTTDDPNNPKEWVSLTHASLTPEGKMLCGSVSITSEASIPTIGKYYSTMALSIGLNVTSEAAGTPINRYMHFTPTHKFHVND